MAFTQASFSPANLIVYYIICTANLSQVISQNTQKTMQDKRWESLKLLKTTGHLEIFIFSPFLKRKIETPYISYETSMVISIC